MKKVKYKSALKKLFLFSYLKKNGEVAVCVVGFFFFFGRTPVIGR